MGTRGRMPAKERTIMTLLNHEKNQLDEFMEKHGVEDTLQGIMDVLEERGYSDLSERMKTIQKGEQKYIITSKNIHEIIRQARSYLRAAHRPTKNQQLLLEALSTRRVERALKGEGKNDDTDTKQNSLTSFKGVR